MSFTIHHATDALHLRDYPEDAIFFFDFDGVLATQCEEKVYRLDEKHMERRRLEEMAEVMGIDHSLYNTPYLRHLILQAVLINETPEPNLSFHNFARELQQRQRPYFVVTARSGLYAVSRLTSWLSMYALLPQEVFCLGRSSKADLLAKLRTDWPDRPFVFFDDTPKHIDACVALADPLLEIVRVDWPICDIKAEGMRRSLLGVA